jgi:hypothetical protein
MNAEPGLNPPPSAQVEYQAVGHSLALFVSVTPLWNFSGEYVCYFNCAGRNMFCLCRAIGTMSRRVGKAIYYLEVTTLIPCGVRRRQPDCTHGISFIGNQRSS